MSDLLRTRGLLRAERLSADHWRTEAERLARLLARDRVALARVKAQRDGVWTCAEQVGTVEYLDGTTSDGYIDPDRSSVPVAVAAKPAGNEGVAR